MKDCLLPIDFTDPGVLQFHGNRISIDTQEKYEAVGAMLEAHYKLRGLNAATDPDAWEQLRRRVLGGQDWREIVDRLEDDLDDRYPGTKQD